MATLKFLSGLVTQASNDAFVTGSMATGLANLSLGYRVRRIEYQLPAPVEGDSDVEVQLVRRIPTAMVAITDRTLIHDYSAFVKVTTSGIFLYHGIVEVNYPNDFELLIVEDPIYFSLDTTGTSASNSARFRVYYEEVRLSETAKLAALTESLNA